MRSLSDYDYELPEGAIAQEPLQDRSASRLLVLHKETGAIEHRRFRDVTELLAPGDLLVLNDTRVTALRLFGFRPTGGKVELLLLQPMDDGDFLALAKPSKRLPQGSRVQLDGSLEAAIVEDLGEGRKRIRISGSDDLEAALQAIGTTPLPPYIHRPIADAGRYQTVYAATPGSSAAPTAGLHFTEQVLSDLVGKGVQVAKVTLDVGEDTFRAIQQDDLSLHRMHGERCAIPTSTAEAIQACKGRIIAVGTTAVRTLETFATGPRQVTEGSVVSELFIQEGFKFQIVDGMFTNFHLPKTSMLLMISALAGHEAVFRAYREALDQGYRFASFGDSMLIL